MAPPFRNCLDLEVDTKSGEAPLHQSLWAVCSAIHPDWGSITREALEVKMVSGGITNILYKVTADGAPPLLVRVYGDKTEMIIDRKKETHLLKQLSDSEFSVPYHGSFANGRIEGWTTLRSLNPEEMSIFDGPVDFAGLIAGQMAAMHALTPDEPGNPDREPQLWPVTQGWAETAATLRFDDSSARAALYARVDIPHMIEELHWLMRVLPIPAAEESAPIAAAQKFAFASVFCHNDVLSGNVMVDEVTGQCQLIDFEYGSYNFRAFDIANHFCEYSGFDGDWGKWHPTNAQMLRFLRAYVRQSPEGAAVLEGLADEAAREMFMQELLKWTALFCLASHLWWGFWCIIQARYSPIDFDFLDYGRIRFVGYFYHKGLYARYLFSHEGAK